MNVAIGLLREEVPRLRRPRLLSPLSAPALRWIKITDPRGCDLDRVPNQSDLGAGSVYASSPGSSGWTCCKPALSASSASSVVGSYLAQLARRVGIVFRRCHE